MERLLYKQLLEWKNSKSRKPLILNGARQVGKTWLLREFGRREYDSVAYFSCDSTKGLADVFAQGFDMDRILRSLSAISLVDIKPMRTLIIIDEIQELPTAISALKYFCEDAPDYHVAVAGSMLGVALHTGISFPVGKVNTLQLFPMNFIEFANALGYSKIAEMIEQRDYDTLNGIHETAKELLRQYYYVGGMPEVVKSYVENKELKSVRTLQDEILSNYANDFSKHAPSQEVPRIDMVWRSIPAQLAKENKKFIYGVMKQGGRAKEFEMAIQWLMDAGLVYKISRCVKVQSPIKFYEDFSAFKLFVLDCGLLGAMMGTLAADMLIGDNAFVEFKGAFTENYVAEQLISTQLSPIYYYSSDTSRMEIDFVAQGEHGVIPIEVKAEGNVRANSLHNYLKEHPELKAIRLSMLPHRQQETIENVSLYCACGILNTENNQS